MAEKLCSDVLTRLALSPVKADQTAIERLEREAGMGITEIIADLQGTESAAELYFKGLDHQRLLPYPRQAIVYAILHGTFLGFCIMTIGLAGQLRNIARMGLAGFGMGFSFAMVKEIQRNRDQQEAERKFLLEIRSSTPVLRD